MTTLRDIANHANVSTGTVSLMLNGKANLRQQTRQRIEHAIRVLGYERRPVGRPSIATNQRCIALVVPVFTPKDAMLHPLQRQRLTCLRQALSAGGDQVSMFAGIEHVEDNWGFHDAVLSGDINGVILISPGLKDGYVDWLYRQKVPTVVTERLPEHQEFSSVCVDSFGGGYQAGVHLTKLQHRRLAFVSVEPAYRWTELRQAGFAQAVQEAGVQLLPPVSLIPEAAPADHLKRCQKLLDQGATGVFAANDGVGIQCLMAFDQLGVRVPQDISIVGFDDLDLKTNRPAPRLTSIGYDMHHVAQATVEIIRRLLTTHNTLTQLNVCVQTQLHVHQTTGEATSH